MHLQRLVAFLVPALAVVATLNSKHPHDAIQAFKTIASLRHVIAIFTSSSNPQFRCLISDAMRFDPEHMVATYVWTFNDPDANEKKTATFDISPGSVPDQLTFYVDHDFSTPYTAHYNYSNYENCLVAIIPYHGEKLCMLWADSSIADSIPSDCQQQYEDTCNVRFLDYDKKICNF
uniref:Lipocalin/cytosolic fatty-acid binding domain-containing protein n=1 Tax=Amblyomma maculatum TaxID=34609 RepID=G3MP20_AMBMU